MNLKRVFILLSRELLYGSKSFLFIFALVTPLVISLIVSLVFGTLFSEKPKVGLVDEGQSQMISLFTAQEFIISQIYDSTADLREAVASGHVDIGYTFPERFDERIQQGEETELIIFVWGESLITNRGVLAATLGNLLLELTEREAAVEIVSTTLGEGENIPWYERLLPLLILMAVVMGGSLVPASSLIEEKQKKTLKALMATPTTLGDVLLSKGLLGIVLSLLTAVLLLLLNRALGTQPLLLLLVLTLGATLAATFGVFLGAFAKDVNTLFATLKATGILLYAPALLNFFPQIPEWVAKLFPTYYIVAPVMEISQNGSTWSDIATDVFILMGLIAVMFGLLSLMAPKLQQQE